MNNIQIGEKLEIHEYKHNGKVYRAWDEAVLLFENEEYAVYGNDCARVKKDDGLVYNNAEPNIMYFFKNNFYNVIGQLKKRGLYYKCNIASPYIIDNKTIKFIDYDLDLKIFPDGSFRILDRMEYKRNKKEMGYSDELDEVLNEQLSSLIQMFKDKEGPFAPGIIKHYYEIYKENTMNK